MKFLKIKISQVPLKYFLSFKVSFSKSGCSMQKTSILVSIEKIRAQRVFKTEKTATVFLGCNTFSLITNYALYLGLSICTLTPLYSSRKLASHCALQLHASDALYQKLYCDQTPECHVRRTNVEQSASYLNLKNILLYMRSGLLFFELKSPCWRLDSQMLAQTFSMPNTSAIVTACFLRS